MVNLIIALTYALEMTFAHVVKLETMKLLLALAVIHGWVFAVVGCQQCILAW